MFYQLIHPESYLAVLDTFHKHNGRQNVFWCKVICTACGTEKDIRKGDVFGLGKHGKSKSCGCMQRKLASEANSIAQSKITPPGSRENPMYMTWWTIRKRCYNPKSKSYKDYGGRGITMYPEWIDNFPAFAKWVDTNLGPRPEGHSLDRIDNSKGYFPDNLRWADIKTQVNNTRRNIRITHDEKTLTLAQWVEATGIKYEALLARHKKGLTPNTGLFDPPKKKSRALP